MNNSCCSSLGQIFAALLLRLWVGIRLLMSGIDKWRAGKGADTTFTNENYQDKAEKIAEMMTEYSFLPKAMNLPFAQSLGYLLVGFGVLVLLGIFRSFSLLVGGFIFLSLAFGLAALPDDEQMLFLGIHVAITAFALSLAKHDLISVDGIFGKLLGKRSKSEDAE
jgi:thiosulfate dehydrogenase (quinone) large subunit